MSSREDARKQMHRTECQREEEIEYLQRKLGRANSRAYRLEKALKDIRMQIDEALTNG